jgi:tetrapyrrole methylase family protein/MazG family protein
VEECYELVDAIDAGNVDQHLDELGDVLLQVVLQSEIRKEEEAFCFDDVANHLSDKLIRRHPHIFGNVIADTTEDVIRNWVAIKAEEKQSNQRKFISDGIPRHLPSLQRAHKIQERASRVGFDWDNVEDVLSKVEEELNEVREALASGDARHVKEELGDLLFSVVNLSRFEKSDPNAALDGATKKFVSRFSEVEKRIKDSGRSIRDCTLKELDAEWDTVKKDQGTGS